MRLVLDCFVPGRPKTKGSVQVVNGRRGVVRDTPASHRWRQQVAYVARQVMADRARAEPLSGRIVVGLVFYLPVGDVTQRQCGDLDKLERNVLDALGCTDPDDARLYVDDVQVVRIVSEKRPATSNNPAGLSLRVWEE